MTDVTPPTAGLDAGLITYTHIIYGLYALSVLIGLTGPATVIGSYVFGLPSIIAVIMIYARRSDARSTWLETHLRWQLRTFWFAVLWMAVAAIVSAPLVLLFGLGIVTFYFAAVVIAAWIIYRVARGWIALRDKRAIYL